MPERAMRGCSQVHWLIKHGSSSKIKSALFGRFLWRYCRILRRDLETDEACDRIPVSELHDADALGGSAERWDFLDVDADDLGLL